MKFSATSWIALLVVLTAASIAVAENDRPSEPKKISDYAELAKAPDKARARQNPFEKDSDAVPAGALLFARHCAECHGDSAEGHKKGPSLRVPQVQNASPGAIFWLISNGVVRRGMPVWSRLPEPQRWQIIAYIKSLGVAQPPPPSN